MAAGSLAVVEQAATWQPVGNTKSRVTTSYLFGQIYNLNLLSDCRKV